MPGRPPKVSLKRKKYIVERYLAEECAGNRAMLKEHGIFRKLAEYAQRLGNKLKPYDFSNDPGIRKYIDELADSTSTMCVTVDAFPVYTPLDIIAVMNSSAEKQEQMLRNREEYYQGLHKIASNIYAEHAEMEEKLYGKDQLIEKLRASLAECESEIKSMKDELSEAKSQNQDLRRVIRRSLEPTRAEALIEAVTTRTDAIEYSRQFIKESLTPPKPTDQKDAPESDFRRFLEAARKNNK